MLGQAMLSIAYPCHASLFCADGGQWFSPLDKGKISSTSPWQAILFSVREERFTITRTQSLQRITHQSIDGHVSGPGRWNAIGLRVVHVMQIQSPCRRRYPGLAAVAGFEHFLEPFDRRSPVTDGQQTADNVACHVMKERVATNMDAHPGGMATNKKGHNEAERVSRLTPRGAKGAEIMFSEKRLRGPRHFLRIERLAMPMAAMTKQRRRLSAVGDQITIMAAACIVTGVKILTHGNNRLQTDIGRQTGIATGKPGVCFAASDGVEMGDLSERVDTGIRTSGANEFDRMVGNPTQGALQRLLKGCR